MNDRRVEIREYLKGVETDGPVHEGPEQTHGQGPRVDARVSIRVAAPWDLERLRGMFSRASSETIYRRFHLTYPVVPEQMLALMLDPDRHDGGSLVAVVEEEIVGHAMYARLGDGSEVEMAIVVEDGWQSKGVGKSLLFELAQRARLRGVDTLIGQVLGENRRMLGLAAAVFTGTGYAMGDGVCRVCMPLKTPGPAASTAQTHRQVA